MERKIEDVLAETSVLRASLDEARSTIMAPTAPANLSAEFAGLARSMSSLREALDLADAIVGQAILLAANTTPDPAQPRRPSQGIIDQVDTMLAHIRSLETSIAAPRPAPPKPAD